ncbi:MAG: translation initiation factor IF-2 [Mariniphaga sp.]|nr:translation initiation factor IF-2 [Mariniphaga sp.]
MITGEKGSRLSKIARELNVGITTLVDYLHKQGFKISTDPNTKIEADMHELLEKQFRKDHEARIEADKVNLRHHRAKNESVTIEDLQAVKKEPEEADADDDSIMIKDHSLHHYKDEKRVEPIPAPRKPEAIPVTPKPAPVAVVPQPEAAPVSDVEKPKITVVGQVDLDNINHPKAKPKEVKTEIPVTEKKAVAEQPVIEKPIDKPAEKPVAPPVEKPVVEVKAETEIQVAEVKVTPAPVVEVKPVVIAGQHEEPESTEPKTEMISNVSQIENNIKVIGKIDLNPARHTEKPKTGIIKKKLTTRRASEEMSRSQTERPVKTEIVRENDSSEISENTEEIFKLERKKLVGPTVVGHIDLPVEEKKKSTRIEDHQSRNKKKRKRVPKDVKERVDLPEKKLEKAKDKVDKPESKLKKKISLVVKKRSASPAKPEVKDEDVQKQIKETLARLTTKGLKTKGSKYRRDKRIAFSEKLAEQSARDERDKSIIKVTEFVSVNELASMMDVPPTKVIATCMSLGLFVSINQRLDAETMAVVADEFGFKVEFISVEVQEAIIEEEDHKDDLVTRPPIVTVMGHVDHGKTSLLDYIRKANVIAGEAGGITQHIGAYNVTLESGRKITFLDTPGHEAFTAMRARGAQVTDIVIIIVAADDDIMPQTIEAINHAQAASVPIIFAINKIDKNGADPEKIKQQLANMNFLVEDWGGKYQSQDISAKGGQGVAELLEKVLLEADMLELKANPNKRALGSVIESSLDKGRGYVATILVQSGTLNVGDVILAGPHFGHIKAMFNERNQRVESVGPAEPVLILGLNGAPQAGDKFNVMEGEREARLIANKREQLQREQGLRTQKHITLDEIGRRIAIGNFQELNIIVKGDVDGSIEALSDTLIKLSVGEIQVNVIHKAVGQITESDIMLASASNAIIVGFQVRPSLSARKLAEKEGIDIRLYSIIYDAINEVKSAMEGMLAPEIKEEIKGTAEILTVFNITKVGTIAGCIVRDGKILRNSKVRLIRDGIVVFTGDLESLKRFKDDVKDVAKGYECGLNIRGYNDLKEGDFIEAFEQVEVAKTLD